MEVEVQVEQPVMAEKAVTQVTQDPALVLPDASNR